MISLKKVVLLMLIIFVYVSPNFLKSQNTMEIVSFLSEYSKKLVRTHHLSGVILLVQEDKILFHQAYGLASRRYNVPNKLDTRFNLASASKMFTAVAIGQLMESGKLSLNDHISKYLDKDWVSNKVGEKVLIKHLLSHTAGFGHYWTDEFDRIANTLRSLKDYQPLVSDKLAFEPGSKWQYSNTGYLLLGVIIEKVTGQSFYEYVQKRIFDPVGMNNSGFYELDKPIKNLATGYWEDKEDGGKLRNNTFLHGIRSASAGGGWSTSIDMLHFMQALLSDKLISAKTREIFFTPNPLFERYGYGFQIKNDWIGHNGGFPGIEAWIRYYPKKDLILVVLTNYYDSGWELIKKLKKRFKM
jgi:CubicO group peptidase (beta-lactamase class C family)